MNKSAHPDDRNGPSNRKRLRERKPLIQWNDADAEELHNFISSVTHDGAAVMFGKTMDGRSLSVLVLAGNDKYRRYVSDIGDLTDEFEDILFDMDLLLPSDGSGTSEPNPKSK